MRLLLLTLTLALLAVTAYAADPDVPEDLHDADYITAVDVEAEVPYGELFIDEAVIAIFPRLEDRLAGMLVGRVRLKLRPQSAPGASPGGGRTARPVEFRIEQAYLSASLDSAVKIAPKGRALAARSWDKLKQSERDEFLRIYNETRAADWLRTPDDVASGTRDPRGKEFFTSVWAKRPRALGGTATDQELLRFDIRVSATGNEVSLTDRSTEAVLFQLPAPAAATAAPSGTSP
jgi:hypothetical protein